LDMHAVCPKKALKIRPMILAFHEKPSSSDFYGKHCHIKSKNKSPFNIK